MTYADPGLETTKAIPFRIYFPRTRLFIAQTQDKAARSFLTFNSFLAYLADKHGPTSSASLLAYDGIAAAGAVLYEAWYADHTGFDRPGSGLIRERGCLRKLAGDLHLRAVDEIEVHRKIFGRSFEH
jgi:hypothetical protein